MLSSLLPDTPIFKKSFITCPPKRACHRTRELVAGLPALHGRVYQNESNNR
jgi:hypothetical protein